MNRIVLLIFMFSGFVTSSSGQQEPLNELNFYNPLLYNPAVTGSMKQNQVFILNRSQWKEFDGPQVKLATADYRFKKIPGSTGIIFNDLRSGAYTITKIKGNYTHHLQLADELHLLLGLSGGVSMNRFNVSEIAAIRMDDPVLMQAERGTMPDFDGGIQLKGATYNAGVTFTQIEGDMFASGSPIRVPARQLAAYGLYNLSLDEDSMFVISPLVIARTSKGTPFSFDANLTASWNGLLFIGAGYKSGYAAQVNAGLQFKNIRAGYSYEMPVNSLKGVIPPAHEIGLGYVFNTYSQSKQKKPKVVKQVEKTEKPPAGKAGKSEVLASKRNELRKLQEELSDREDNLISHEKKIYALIDSLYSKAGQQKSRTNEEELARVANTQREVNRIKEELKQFTKEKNVELFKLRQKIDALRREIDALEN